MKKNYMFILSVLFISILLVSSVYAFSLANFFKLTGNVASSSANFVIKTCADSDSGLDYSTKGAVKICQINKKNNKTTCNTYSDTCTGRAGNLQEKYCKNNNVATKVYKCPSGCKDGACLQPTNQTLTCTDSDGGVNIYVKGYIIQNGNRFDDNCLNEIIDEYYCNSSRPNALNVFATTCPSGCKEGACVKSKFKFENSGSYTIKVLTPILSGALQGNILSGNGKEFNNIGGELGTGKNLITSPNKSIQFDRDTDYAFIATYSSGIAGESYYLTVSSISKEDAGANNYTTIKNIVSGQTAGNCERKKNADSCQIGNVILSISNADADAQSVRITILSSNTYFDRLYNTDSDYILLPLNSNLPAKEFIMPAYTNDGQEKEKYQFYWENGKVYVG